MKFICAPDSFKESLDASRAAAAMATGIRRVLPDADVVLCPVGDGGEGTLDALLQSGDGLPLSTQVSGANGSCVDGRYGTFHGGKHAFVESAAAVGLGLIPAAERRAMHAHSVGVGELILAAARQKPERIIVGVGGTASNDAGCGMAQTLGIRFFDRYGRQIKVALSGRMLTTVDRIDPSGSSQLLDECQIIAACDVVNPLFGINGAARVYGPQKGASADEVEALDEGFCHIAGCIARDLGIDVQAAAGAGAGGGLGAGLLAFAGATLTPGIELVLDLVRFSQRAPGAVCCLTGEGRLDAQSLAGKACLGVAQAAAGMGIPTIALVGAWRATELPLADAGLLDCIVIGKDLPEWQSMQQAEALLTNAAAGVAERFRQGSLPA